MRKQIESKAALQGLMTAFLELSHHPDKASSALGVS
jgi:hypothetical protein